mgnify:CR=1 FL=1
MYWHRLHSKDIKVRHYTRLKWPSSICFVWLSVNLFLGLAACSNGEFSAKQQQIPHKTFSLNDVFIEARNQNHVEWQGNGTTSEGDLDLAHIENLVLHKRNETSEEILFTLKAPKALLNFQSGTMTLTQTTLEEKNGSRIHGAKSIYRTEKNDINIQGPILFIANHLEMRAESANVDLEIGLIKAHGPIVGKVHIND